MRFTQLDGNTCKLQLQFVEMLQILLIFCRKKKAWRKQLVCVAGETSLQHNTQKLSTHTNTHAHTRALCVTTPPARGGILSGLGVSSYWVRCSDVNCRCWHSGRRRFSRLLRWAATWEQRGRVLIQERQPNEWIPEGGGAQGSPLAQLKSRTDHPFIHHLWKKRINWNSI